MQLIDSHAHIYLPEFDSDRDLLIENALSFSIERILMPAIDSSTHEAMFKTEEQFPGCTAMIGLHPCSVNEGFNNEIEVVKIWLLQRKFIGIGEIGLDFYWGKTFTTQQYDAFHQQIGLAIQYNLPIVIHSRNATEECLDVVQQYPGLKGVFHCFSGTAEQAQKIIETGFLLGIGGVVTFKNSGLDKIIEGIGIDQVILETDSPYLAPVPFRGKRNEPGYLKYVAEKLAWLTGKTVEEVASVTTNNAINLFNLS